MNYPERPLQDVLRFDIDKVDVQAEGSYQIAGVYGFGRGLFEREGIKGSDTQYSHLHRLHAGDLVMSKLKAFEGAIAVIPKRFDNLYLSPEFPTFAIDDSQADERYIHHLCSWPHFWSRLADKSTGIGSRRERVKPGQLLATAAPLPDVSEQRRVAARLDLGLAKLEAAAALRTRQSAIRTGLLESHFTHLEKTDWAPLKDLVELERPPVELHDDQTYVQIGIRSFGRGIFHRDAVKPDQLSKLKYFQILPGRLIVSNIMAWEGAVALSAEADAGCIGSQRFLSFAPTGPISAAFLNYYFQTRQGRTALSDTSTGTVKRNQTLSINDFMSISVPVPSLEQQRRIVAMLNLTEQHIDRLSRYQSDIASTARTGMLNAAFSGHL